MRHVIICFFLLTFGFTLAQNRKVITTYGYETTQNTQLIVTSSESIQMEKFYLNSKSNALVKGGKNRTIFPIRLPKNTDHWYYRFTASRNEEVINQTLNSFILASEFSQYVNSEKPIQNAIQNLTTPPGAHICDVYILDESNAKLFKDKADFSYDISASRENYKSGNVSVNSPERPLTYMGINNPDNLHGIHVSIEIVAVIKRETMVRETIRIPIYTSFAE